MTEGKEDVLLSVFSGQFLPENAAIFCSRSETQHEDGNETQRL